MVRESFRETHQKETSKESTKETTAISHEDIHKLREERNDLVLHKHPLRTLKYFFLEFLQFLGSILKWYAVV